MQVIYSEEICVRAHKMRRVMGTIGQRRGVAVSLRYKILDKLMS